MNNTKNVPHDPKFQQRLEKQEQRDHRTEHIFRRVLHVIERVIAAVTLVVLLIAQKQARALPESTVPGLAVYGSYAFSLQTIPPAHSKTVRT